MLGEAVTIDPSSTRASFSDQPVAPGSAPRALRQAAESAGLDPVAELYNEALHFSSEGQFKEARERLAILVGLAPEDGEARLLLAKVHVAGQRWTDALAALDEAEACGQQVAPALRASVEEHLRADRAMEEAQRAQRATRDQGDVKANRQEVRRLRSDNAQLTGRVNELERDTRKWAGATVVISSLFIVFLLGNLLFGGGSSELAPEGEPVADAAVDGGVAAPPVADPAAPAAPETVADRVFATLQATADLNQLTVGATADGGIVLSGTVPTARSLRSARDLVGRVQGVTSVTTDEVEILARTRGTTYTVANGDTLGGISQAHYGSAGLSERILAANSRTLKDARSLRIGQELVIPAVE